MLFFCGELKSGMIYVNILMMSLLGGFFVLKFEAIQLLQEYGQNYES